MALRTFVSFEADFPAEVQPPGRELAQFISSALTRAGIEHLAPEEREDWAWTIDSKIGKIQIESIVGFSDDGPRQWQIHTYGHLGFFKWVLGLGRSERAGALRKFCIAIDQAIKGDQRFRNIRWYEQRIFERDHGQTWSEVP